jgi:hypothetical protein
MNGCGQELAPGPDVVAQVQRHGRRPSSKVPMERDLRQPQGKMWAQPVVFKEVDGEQAVPRRGSLGERMCLAREGIQPIPHASVEPFEVVRSGMVDQLPQSGPHLNREEMAVRVTMLDRLRHLEGVRHDEWWLPPSAGPLRLAILLGQHLGIAMPAIGTPGEGALSGPCGRLGDGPRDELVANAPGGTRHDKTTGTVEHARSSTRHPSVRRCWGDGLPHRPTRSRRRQSRCHWRRLSSDKGPELVDLDGREVQVVDEHGTQRLGMLPRQAHPPTNRLVFMPRDFLRCAQAAASHHNQERLGYLVDWSPQPIQRGALGRTEPGPTHTTVVALLAAQRPVAHHMGLLGRPDWDTAGTGGVGAYFPSCPPSPASHMPAESPPKIHNASGSASTRQGKCSNEQS